jgi:hypothetical protein
MVWSNGEEVKMRNRSEKKRSITMGFDGMMGGMEMLRG